MILAGAIAFLLHRARRCESLLGRQRNADGRPEGESQGDEEYSDDARQPHFCMMSLCAAFVKFAGQSQSINQLKYFGYLRCRFVYSLPGFHRLQCATASLISLGFRLMASR